jgi:hypothetical protein
VIRGKWEIDIKAESPEQTARKALAIQRDPDSTATVFSVDRDDGSEDEIDLTEVVSECTAAAAA